MVDFEINWSVISNRVSVFRKKDLIVKKASNRATPTQMVYDSYRVEIIILNFFCNESILQN